MRTARQSPDGVDVALAVFGGVLRGRVHGVAQHVVPELAGVHLHRVQHLRALVAEQGLPPELAAQLAVCARYVHFCIDLF